MSPSLHGKPWILPLALFAALGLIHAWTSGDQGVGIDFYQFWSVGQAVRESLVEDVYEPAAFPLLARIFERRAEQDGARRHLGAAAFRKDEIQTSNTPFLYTSFYALESGRYETDIRRFRFLSLSVTVFSVIALSWCAGYSLAGTLTILAFILWAFAPLQYDLREGNVNQIQMGCLALFLLIHKGFPATWRHLLGGAVLGLGVAFKPNLAFVPLVLVLAWVIQRRFRVLTLGVAGMASGGLLAVAVSSFFFGSLSSWFRWLETLRRMNEDIGFTVRWGSFGGARLLADWTGLNFSPLLHVLFLAAVGLSVWKWSRKGAPEYEGLYLVLGIGSIVPLLATDMAWPHYLVQAIPLAIFLLRPRGVEPLRAWLLLAALAGICSSPVLDFIGTGNDYVYAGALALGSLLLFVLGCRELLMPGPETSPR
jgi:hypothetical protein